MGVPSRILKDSAGEEVLGEVKEKPSAFTVLDRLKTLEDPHAFITVLEEILLELRTIRKGMEMFVWDTEIYDDVTKNS